jgi:hypothetical protein
MQMLLCQLDQANTGPTAVLGPFSTHLPAACQALPCQRSPGTAGAMSHSRADKDGGLLAKAQRHGHVDQQQGNRRTALLRSSNPLITVSCMPDQER